MDLGVFPFSELSCLQLTLASRLHSAPDRPTASRHGPLRLDRADAQLFRRRSGVYDYLPRLLAGCEQGGPQVKVPHPALARSGHLCTLGGTVRRYEAESCGAATNSHHLCPPPLPPLQPATAAAAAAFI